MANICVSNHAPPRPTDFWSATWKLTRAMKAAGYHTIASSDGVTKNTSSLDNQDLWGSGSNPLNDAEYASGAVGSPSNLFMSAAWILMQGPSTLKIYFDPTTYTGTFVRGENIYQLNTNATAEILSITMSGSTGFIVALPRTTGSGLGNQGWSTTDGITGSTSNASIVASGSRIYEFVREFVFWKPAVNVTYYNYQGTIYHQCVDKDGEAGERFAARTGSVGCTATVAPGGGGTNNSFPVSGTYVIRGTGGSAVHAELLCNSVNVVPSSHLIVANATPALSTSADGTFTCAYGCPWKNAGSYNGFHYGRMDNYEDGEVDPYVWVALAGVSAGNPPSRTSNVVNDTSINTTFFSIRAFAGITGAPPVGSVLAWRARGTNTSGDSMFVGASIHMLNIYYSAAWLKVIAPGVNISNIETVGHSLQRKFVRNSIGIAGVGIGCKTRKGTFRWLYLVPGGNGNDTYENGQYVQLSNMYDNASTIWGLIVGPWDGSTAYNS